MKDWRGFLTPRPPLLNRRGGRPDLSVGGEDKNPPHIHGGSGTPDSAGIWFDKKIAVQ